MSPRAVSFSVAMLACAFAQNAFADDDDHEKKQRDGLAAQLETAEAGCAAGWASECTRQAEVMGHLESFGGPKADPKVVSDLLDGACGEGHGFACLLLAREQAGDAARASVDKACELGEFVACTDSRPPVCSGDDAFAACRSACEGGDAEACAGLSELRAPTREEHETAETLACDAGVWSACEDSDPERALELATPACENGDPAACIHLLYSETATDAATEAARRICAADGSVVDCLQVARRGPRALSDALEPTVIERLASVCQSNDTAACIMVADSLKRVDANAAEDALTLALGVAEKRCREKDGVACGVEVDLLRALGRASDARDRLGELCEQKLGTACAALERRKRER